MNGGRSEANSDKQTPVKELVGVSRRVCSEDTASEAAGYSFLNDVSTYTPAGSKHTPCSQSATIRSEAQNDLGSTGATFTPVSGYDNGGHTNIVFHLGGPGAPTVIGDIMNAPGFLGLPIFPTGLRFGNFESLHVEQVKGQSNEIFAHIGVGNGKTALAALVHWTVDVGIGQLLGAAGFGSALDACHGQ